MTYVFTNHSGAESDSNGIDLQAQDGKLGTIEPLNENDFDRAEVGDMFRFTADDGTVFDVFADELHRED